MWSYYIWSLALFTLALSNPRKIKEGDRCIFEYGKRGTCKRFLKCRSALSDYYLNNNWPVMCGRKSGLICCEDVKPRITQATERSTAATTTTTKEPIAEFGRKSKEKCHEYSKWLNLPVSLAESERVPGICGVFDQPKILDRSASHLEFPHMALLGYGNTSYLRYQCSASLISEQYLLTPAHCLILKNTSGPILAKLGNGDRNYQKILKIEKKIPHPDYSPPQKYNDIALIRLEKPLEFTDYIRPACLQTEIVTGNIEMAVEAFFARGSEYILKKNLPIVNHSQCSQIYPRNFYLRAGIDDKSMMCAGIFSSDKDECHDDAGGPLQIIKKKPHCMYGIVAIASFGKHCSVMPDVYTRISNYIPWIESIVWPDAE